MFIRTGILSDTYLFSNLKQLIVFPDFHERQRNRTISRFIYINSRIKNVFFNSIISLIHTNIFHFKCNVKFLGKKDHYLKKELHFSKNRNPLSFLERYNFYPQKAMLFVTFAT